MGVDIARSRIDFANLWAENLALDVRISFKAMDLLDFPEPSASYSMCICITGAFGFFPFLRENGDSLTLEYFNRLLDSNGWLLLELYNHPVNKRRCLEEKDNVYRHWEELPEQDPFSYYLSERTFDPVSKVMQHKKIFVRRSDGFIDDSRMEALRLYDRGEVLRLLDSSGFDVLRFDSDWRDTVFKDDDEVSVVFARKK